MSKPNLALIFRNFKKFKGTFFINLIDLSTGLAYAFLISLWVNDELKVDNFNEKDNRLFQVMEHQQYSGNIRITNSTPGLLAETLAEEMPEVEFAATVTPSFWFEKSLLSFENTEVKSSGIYAGKYFFKIFSFELIEGDENQVLTLITNFALSMPSSSSEVIQYEDQSLSTFLSTGL